MASSSLVLPSLAPKSLVLSKPTSKSSPSSLFFNSVSLKTTTKSFSISSERRNSSRFVRKVSLTSEFDQEEEVGSRGEGGGGGGGRPDAHFAQELKLFVGNLSFNVDSAQLAGLFERAGNVEMVEVIYDKMTGRSRGFAFVTMSTVEEVKAAAQQFDGYELDGRSIRVNFGPPPPKGEFRGSQGGGGEFRGSQGGGGGGGGGGSSTRCYVGNLSWGVDDEALETLFSEQGKVLEARVVYDRESGRSRGFGFVTYGSSEEVENAISSLNGVDLNGREIRVSAAEERQRRF